MLAASSDNKPTTEFFIAFLKVRGPFRTGHFVSKTPAYLTASGAFDYVHEIGKLQLPTP